jgi:hypothetical protein
VRLGLEVYCTVPLDRGIDGVENKGVFLGISVLDRQHSLCKSDVIIEPLFHVYVV